MATKIASLFVEVGAKIDGLLRGLSQAKKETESTGGSLSSLAGTLVKLGGAAATVGATLKTAFDLGEAGAQIAQVESSFNSLLATLGAAPDTLQQMQDATRNTVSELDLMASSTTFLKGATGEMGGAFADALPELANIAQAAHDLNPTMGTTAEMFDRLTRGVRKAEPELLDEMGLIFRLDNVYRDYAKSIGKTANELTVEEKAMATLNEVLRQGNGLVVQAAGVNTNLSDSFGQLSADTKNAADSIKESLAPGLANAATAADILLYGTQKLGAAIGVHSQQVVSASSSYAEYEARQRAAAEAMGYSISAFGNLTNSMGLVISENYLLTAGQWASAKSAEGLANASAQLSGGLSMLDQRAAGVANSVTSLDGGLSRLGEGPLSAINTQMQAQTEQVGMSEQAWSAYGERMTAAAEAAGMTAITMDQLQIMAVGLAAGLEGTLGDAITNYTAGLGELQTQQAEIQTQLDDLAARGVPETSAQYQQLTAALNENKAAQEGALESLQMLTAETIYQQAAVGLDTQAALDLARSMGVLSEADYATATAVQALRQEFDMNADGAISAAEGADRYAAAVDLVTRSVQSLQAKNMPVTLDNIQKEMTELASADASGELNATASAAGNSSEEFETLGETASDASGGVDDVAGAADDTAEALKSLMGAGSSAKAGLDTVRKGAQDALGVLRNAASAAESLGDGMRSIPRSASISVTTTGFAEAVQWVEDLADAINSIPSSVTASITLTTGGGGGGGGGGGPAPRAGPSISAPTNITNNIYDPLAAAIVHARQVEFTASKLNALMGV